MEDIYRDGFERMLKENADRFTMNPSPRVWSSLYNNMHPSKKWPSPATWLLISFFWLVISPAIEHGNSSKSSSIYGSNIAKSTSLIKVGIHPTITISALMELSGSKNPYAARITVNEKSKEVNLKVTEENIAANNNKVSGEDENPNAGKPDLIALLRQFENLKRAKSPGFVKSEKSVRHYYPVFAANGEVPSGKAEDYPQTTEEKDYPSGKFGYEIYATPSIGFRGTPRGTSANMETEEGNYPDQAKENERRTIPAFNLEAGGSISYALSGIMRFKAGLQLNYSKFNKADADNLQPASAFLMQENDAALSTDMQGTDRRTFINQSYQVSLPLGADLKIADAANIEWFAGASVQPTFNLRSGAALPYQDPGLNENDINNMRSWNINGGIETFISYHAGKRIRLNAGPQLRYQLLSSYRNEFMLNERLYNIGIKLGISSRF